MTSGSFGLDRRASRASAVVLCHILVSRGEFRVCALVTSLAGNPGRGVPLFRAHGAPATSMAV